MNDAVLVTGGAGYIGSHMVKLLLARGYPVVTLDDLSTGFADAVVGGVFVQGDVADAALLAELFARHRIVAVMHFAASSRVGESVARPLDYYGNNVAGLVTLLKSMQRHGVDRFVLSSSAAVYGVPERVPIAENQAPRPINPYGHSKWMAEQILADAARAHGLRSASLRYFNAAGADPDGDLGERHEPETHLIPLTLEVAAGSRPTLDIFGDDWPTPDGTAIRDYIHVVDLCEAHLRALRWLDDHVLGAFNLGTGHGYSVAQVVHAVERVTQRAVPIRLAARRPGDPPVLVADGRRAQSVFAWRPHYSGLDRIIADAWRWYQRAHIVQQAV